MTRLLLPLAIGVCVASAPTASIQDVAWLQGCRELRDVFGREVVFEDPTDDFPQRVGYRSTGSGQLLARVEGMSGGKTRRVEFGYRLVNCIAP